MPQFLSDIYTVNNRFQRSIQVVQDWDTGKGLDGYLLSTTARQIAEQIILGIRNPDYSTAWTITGPYGTGKSAFALFLTDILANKDSYHSDAQKIKDQSEEPVPHLYPVLIQGQQANIKIDLANALADSLVELNPRFSKKIKQSLKSTIENRTVVDFYIEAISVVQESNYEGILVIIDEFGKFLEFAAANPTEVDLLLIQDLAEAATRTPNPFGLITILHSAFTDYLSDVEEEKKAEWQKVQGRFSDISFIEPAEQFLKLIGAAINAEKNNDYVVSTQKKGKAIINSSAYNEVRKRINLDELVINCLPLHPGTALLLWPLFRSSLSQNERSLFSFLNDYNPNGFQDFLTQTELSLELYTIADLYDYVTFTVGDGVLLSLHARRWGEISNAVNRIQSDAPVLCTELVKTIGLVSIFGAQIGLFANQDFLYSLNEDSSIVKEAINYLEKKSILIFRKFQGAYGIWEGSDIDLDSAYASAKLRQRTSRFSERLENLIDIKPIVARANYINKGTMRYFDVVILDGEIENINSAFDLNQMNSDGAIFFVLSEDKESRNILIQHTKEKTKVDSIDSRPKIFAFPKPFKGLESALAVLENWQWVKVNTPALAGDRVARQEVQAQIHNATNNLLNIAGESFGLPGYLFKPEFSVWVRKGELFDHKSSVGFQKWLSTICNEVYSESPTLFNELLNRENLSSAAAAIRRNLVQRMLEKDGEVDLGFTQTPPEYSMYRSLLVEGGFYCKRPSGLYSFKGLPVIEWQPIWLVMNEFLNSTSNVRKPLLDLYGILKSPPFGLREGPIPVLITALLLANKDQIALYEDGRFIPEIRTEILELLIKVPEIFEIQLYKLAGEKKAASDAVEIVLEQLDLKASENDEQQSLLDIVKPLVIFVAKLPEYTRKSKKFEVDGVIEARDAILRANDPYELLFTTLPSILEFELDSQSNIDRYSSKLLEILSSLAQAYPNLLDRIEENFRDAFGYEEGITSVELRNDLIKRATPLEGYTTDPTIKLFIRETKKVINRDWREILSRSINQGLPTAKWLDRSVVDFQIRLAQFASEFIRLETLVREKQQVDDDHYVLQVSVLNGQLKENRKIVTISKTIDDEAQALMSVLEAELETSRDQNVKFVAIGKLLEKLMGGD